MRTVNVKSLAKQFVFRLLGVEPEAVVVSFLTGEAALGARMAEEIRGLTPDRGHYVVTVGAAP